MTTTRTPFATARGLLTDHQGRWLLVRDDRPWWYLPGGWIEPTDDSPSAACRREVFEETGAEVTPAGLLVISCHADGWSLIFDCGLHDSATLTLTTENDPETPKSAEVRWMPPREALEVLKPAISARMKSWLHSPRLFPLYIE